MLIGAMRVLAEAEAKSNPLDHVKDVPWHGFDVFGAPILSAQIAVMILAALLLLLAMIGAARVRAYLPRGRGYNLVEIFVIFVRDFIARPALHDTRKIYRYLPFILTLFFFLLFCNLLGMVPLLDISHAIPALHGTPVGGTPTSNLFMVGGLVGMTFLVIVFSGVNEQVQHYRHHKGLPAPIGWLLGFFLYLWSLVPSMPPAIKIPMSIILIPLEFIGVVAKCFALWIRLLANMNAGHILLAVLLGFAVSGLHQGMVGLLVTPVSILGAIAINLLELLVAFIQAFIFTFLASLFIGMAVHPH
ncbi:MAG: ATP synthase subunit a [Phycisphaerae bacterium]|nr:ATP synthase subunit a [Phycisphaerae bacterium]